MKYIITERTMDLSDFDALKALSKDDIIQRYLGLALTLKNLERELGESKELFFHVVKKAEQMKLKIHQIEKPEYDGNWS